MRLPCANHKRTRFHRRVRASRKQFEYNELQARDALKIIWKAFTSLWFAFKPL